MRAGKLRQRITLQSKVIVRDQYGGESTTWQDFATDVPAEVVPLSGREFLSAGELQGEVQARVMIRYMPGVLDTMRMQFDGKVYAIKGLFPDPTARRHITLMVSEGVSLGD